jgi:hypothetical protein
MGDLNLYPHNQFLVSYLNTKMHYHTRSGREDNPKTQIGDMIWKIHPMNPPQRDWH